MTTVLHTRRAVGPKGTFPLGSLNEFRQDPLGLMLRATQRYGDLVRLRFGPVTAHLVNHPDLVQHVLVDHSRRYDKQTRSVGKMRATCGESLLTTDGDLWLRQRRLVQPVFQSARLLQFIPTMQQTIAQRLETWYTVGRRAEGLELVSEMLQLTLQIAAECLFGTSIRDDAPVIERALEIVLDDTWRRLESVVDLAALSPAFHRPHYRKALHELNEVVARIIRERQTQSDRNDLLSALLQAHGGSPAKQLSARELRDIVITLLLAGHETTANALTWTFSLLAEHPHVVEHLVHEIDVELGSDDPHVESLGRLTFAGQVFDEAIRLYPSIWIMERRVVTTDEMRGVKIPAGSTLLISPYVLHRHQQFWSDPDQFDPDRFDAAHTSDRPKYAYIPFGAGPHVCIGQAMAQQVARMMIAMVYQRFQLTLVDGQRPEMHPGITLRHRRAVKMRIVPRT